MFVSSHCISNAIINQICRIKQITQHRRLAVNDAQAFVHYHAWAEAWRTAERKLTVTTDRRQITNHEQPVTRTVKYSRGNQPNSDTSCSTAAHVGQHYTMPQRVGKDDAHGRA